MTTTIDKKITNYTYLQFTYTTERRGARERLSSKVLQQQEREQRITLKCYAYTINK